MNKTILIILIIYIVNVNSCYSPISGKLITYCPNNVVLSRYERSMVNDCIINCINTQIIHASIDNCDYSNAYNNTSCDCQKKIVNCYNELCATVPNDIKNIIENHSCNIFYYSSGNNIKIEVFLSIFFIILITYIL